MFHLHTGPRTTYVVGSFANFLIRGSLHDLKHPLRFLPMPWRSHDRDRAKHFRSEEATVRCCRWRKTSANAECTTGSTLQSLSRRSQSTSTNVERQVGDGGPDQCCDGPTIFWEAEVARHPHEHTVRGMCWTPWWSNSTCGQVPPELTADQVVEAKKVELQKFAERGVHDMVDQSEAERNPDSVMLSAKWVITKKGTMERTPSTVTVCFQERRGCQSPGA